MKTTRLIEIPFSELNPTLRALSEQGATVEDAAWLRQPGNAERLMRMIERARRREQRNPFEISLDETFECFTTVATALSWQFPQPLEAIIARLRETAPAWPRGHNAYRSLRIRWGQGREGMIQTFEAHASALKYVRPKTTRWELLLSGEHRYQDKDVDRLRLLNGNDSHGPAVEWIIVPDLSANRQRRDITSVRGRTSLADEGLVLAWLFPERVDAIDYDKWCAWFCSGYELGVPEGGGGSWQGVPFVGRSGERPSLVACWRSFDDSGCSVPVLQE